MMDENTRQSDSEAPDQTPTTTSHNNTKPTIAIKVYAPFKVYFEGDAFSLSAVNATGPFDVLPKHHNFLCMLVPCELKIQALDGEKSVKINRALMQVTPGHVSVFVDV